MIQAPTYDDQTTDPATPAKKPQPLPPTLPLGTAGAGAAGGFQPQAPTPTPLPTTNQLPLAPSSGPVPQAPTLDPVPPTTMPLAPAPSVSTPSPAPTAPLPIGAPNGPQDLTSGTAAGLRTLAAGSNPAEARSATAGLADMQNGYNWGESQEDLNTRRGMVVNPATGAWEYPSDIHDYTAGNAARNQSAIDDTSKWFQSQGGSAIGASGQPIAGTQTTPGGVLAPVPSSITTPGSANVNQIPGALPLAPSGGPLAVPNTQTAGTPQAPTALPLAGPATTSSGPGGVSLSPGQDLTGSTIGVGPTADRLKLATDAYDTFQKQDDPRFQADVRGAISNGAALGQLGSGGLRTNVGNLVRDRDLRLQGERERLTNAATEGQIGDQYRNVGIAQQQQGFQQGQQESAFGQATQEAALNEALQSGDFSRYMQLLNAGSTGNPSDTQLALANSYGNQAGQAGTAAGNLISGAVANQNNTGIPPWLLQYLQTQSGAGSGSLPLAGRDPGNEEG